MRPQSDVRLDVSAALVDGPATVLQLAQRTGWSIGLVRKAINNMVYARDAYVSHTVRRAGARRPVPVYARLARAVAADVSGLAGLLSSWGRPGMVTHAQ